MSIVLEEMDSKHREEEDSKHKEEEKDSKHKEEGEDSKHKEEEGSKHEEAEDKPKKQKLANEYWPDDEIALISDDNGWKSILTQQAKKSRLLFAFLHALPPAQFLPMQQDVFNAFKLCPFDNVRVVLLGQDPYHGPKQAHGLSFSVQRPIAPPPSLKNIFKEAAADLGAEGFRCNGKSGDLTLWANRGVLMLNTLLTVAPGKPNSHKGKGWETFTDACIAKLSRDKKNLVFLLWGKPAQEKAKLIANKSSHLIINSSHPSPLGAYAKTLPFFGSKCFSRCNEYLVANGLEEIDWSLE